MKNALLLTIFSVLAFTFTKANAEDGIPFLPEETTFEQVLKKAAEENKLVFIDAYTTWCGPCKWLDKNVFSDPEVGEYFNQHFISAKFDMEKGEGIELAKKYKVMAYPTLLFLNSEGEIVHRICGASPKEDFLKKSALALDEEERIGSFVAAYEEGNRELPFLAKLLEKYAQACMDGTEIAAEYWKLQSPEEWASKNNWKVFRNNVKDFNSPQFQYFIEHMDEFTANQNKNEVNAFAENVMYSTLASSIYNNNQAVLESTREQLLQLSHESAKKALIRADIFKSSREKDWKAYAGHAAAYIENFGIDNAGFINSISWTLYENSDDKIILTQAAGWMKDLLKIEQNQNYAFTDTCAALLLKAGNKEEGLKYAQQAIEIAKASGQDYSGTEEIMEKYK